jgi:two-component system, NarL family, sensor kinase
MKLKTLLFFIWLLFYHKGFAQFKDQKKLDDNILYSSRQDTNIIASNSLKAEYIENNYPDSAILIFKKCLEISTKLNYHKGEANSYKNLGILFAKKGNLKEAILYAENGINIVKESIDQKELAIQYANIGTIYAIFNLDDISTTFYSKAIAIFNNEKEYKLISKMYGNAATVFANQNEYQKAIVYAYKALENNKLYKDTFTIIQAYTNLAESYGQLNDTINNEKYIRLAYSIALLTNDDYLKMKSSSSLANWLAENDKPDSCIKIIQQTIKIAKNNNYVDENVEALSTWAWALLQQKKNKEANKKIQEANQFITSSSTSNLTKQYYASVLLDIQKETGNYKGAITTLEWIHILNDSLGKNGTSQNLEKLNQDFTKLEEENIFLKQEVQLKKQKSLIIILLLCSVLLIGGIIFYVNQIKKNKALKRLEIENLLQKNKYITIEASLKAKLQERSRISKEIHDELGSSLTSISLLTEVLKKRLDTNTNPEINKISVTSAEMVDKMNEIIWALNTSNDTVNSLIAYVRKFTNNFLQDANIQLDFTETNIPDNKHLEGIVRRNIYLTIKEAIHNIVKHSNAKRVIVTVNAANGLEIEIKDNGKGISLENIPQFSNGLINMRKRMEDIGGRFTIEKKDGTAITLNY